MIISKLQEPGTNRTDPFAPADILVVKKSYIARAMQKNTPFVLHLRDVTFRATKAIMTGDEHALVLDASRYPVLRVLTSGGYIGYVGAIFFERLSA